MRKLLILFLCISIVSCIDDNTPVCSDYSEENETEILAYLNDNNLDFNKTNSGLHYNISSSGSGVSPTFSDNVTVAYRGYFLNGNTFDESSEATFNVGGVVLGFAEALTLLKPGGSGTFILPSRLGYGCLGSGPIAPGTVIAFDITLISIN